MWIALPDAFLSIVAHRDKPSVLLVRARIEGDIERTFPGARVEVTPTADYLYRAEVRRVEVARVLAELVKRIDYPNFKDAVADDDRHAAYFEVWSTMAKASR